MWAVEKPGVYHIPVLCVELKTQLKLFGQQFHDLELWQSIKINTGFCSVEKNNIDFIAKFCH